VIVITGGAGFIGSVLAWRLNNAGMKDILLVDNLGRSEKWHNLLPLSFYDYLDKQDFIQKLESGVFKNDIDVLFHLGACSSTMEADAHYLMENNYRYSVRIGTWWSHHPSTRLLYASSAATYGNGESGYADNEDEMEKLLPLNMYGYSKHLFDLYAKRQGWLSRIVGLKFFNVFGPNENHKGDMRSVINKAFPRMCSEGKMSLFESYRQGYNHGEQLRDFIYVKDAVEMVLFFMEHRDLGGIYNIGTGKARSWNDIANAMFAALNRKPDIEYIPMPESIREKYQYFTQADLAKLRSVGCTYTCRSLEDSITEYVREYLCKDGLLRRTA
jgi:ADP-L-glycero-D-manno-heptose 6-epimerase